MKKYNLTYLILFLILISIVACSFTSNNYNQDSKNRNFVIENIHFNNDSIAVIFDLDSLQTKPSEKQRNQLKNTLDIITKLKDTIQVALYNYYVKSYPDYIVGVKSSVHKISKKVVEEIYPSPSKKDEIISMYALESIYIPIESEINTNSLIVAYHLKSDEEHEYAVEIENRSVKYVYING
ncbi:MAG TPA: hypothetical protein PKO18_09255 [Chitinophagales bacterium]|nr:hypothetical protein [Chitinophagales bacterium]HNL85413.1 hypothetical protein [Chitinophagales bacterium]